MKNLLTKYCTCSIIIIARAIIGGDYMAPAGRPKTENPRNINLNIRITRKEADDIQECADKLKITRTDAIMKGIHMVKEELEKK